MATITDILDRHEQALLDFERYRAEEMRPFNTELASADNERMRLREQTSARLQAEKERLLSYQYQELLKEAMSLEVTTILNERMQAQEMEQMFAHHEQHTWQKEATQEATGEQAGKEEKPRPLTPAERMKAILKKGKEQDRDQDQER